MEFKFSIVIPNTYSIGLSPPLCHIKTYLKNYLTQKGFLSSLKTLDITFYHTTSPLQGDVENKKGTFWDYYNTLPRIKFLHQRTECQLGIQFPEIHNLENLFKQTPKWLYWEYMTLKDEQEIKTKLEALSEQNELVRETRRCFEYLIRKIQEAFQVIKGKLKKTDIFDCQAANAYLEELLTVVSGKELLLFHFAQKLKLQKDNLERYSTQREQRRLANQEKNKLIRDIRIYCHFTVINNKDLAKQTWNICESIYLRLRKQKFKCPDYTHLYICAAESYEKALFNSARLDNWYMKGLAVMPHPQQFLETNELEKQKLTFALIKEGLLDITEIDKLDKKTLETVLDEVEHEIENHRFLT